MKKTRIIAACTLLVLALFFLLPLTGGVGGDFTLTDQEGKSFNTTSLRGKYVLVFFGFTHCPDVCPTTLYKISDVLRQINRQKVSVAAVFVSVDPEHDTPYELKSYLKHFDPGIVGLTGTKKQVARAKSLYSVYGEVNPGQEVEHSTSVYLIDAKGKYLTHFSVDDAVEDILSRVEDYIHAQG